MSQDGFVGWFTGASDVTPTGIRDREAHQRLWLTAQISGIDDELKTLRDSLIQVEKTPILFEVHADYRKQLAADAERYRTLIRSLEYRRKLLAEAVADSDEQTDA